jgi:hypothetical protein
LRKIEFFSDEELNDMTFAETLSEITQLSVGTNPRSLKRLTNTLALISIINEIQNNNDNSQQERLAKTLNYAMVCIQIAYPYIYNQLTESPNFKEWNEKVASKLKLRPLTELERETLDSTDEFDEEWEKVVFRMCQKETYLSNRVFSVSSLLNKIAELVNDDTQLGDVIASTLELSAVTNLKAFDGPMKNPTKFNRDTSSYKFNGKVYPTKKELVTDIVMYYLSEHPDTTHDQLKEAFSFKKNMDTIFLDYEEYLEILSEKGRVDHFGSHPDVPTIQLADKKVVITSKLPTTVNGKPAEFSKLLDIVRGKLNYIVESC